MPMSSVLRLGLLLLAVVLAACAPATPTPFSIVVGQVDTATPPPSSTPTATETATPTETPLPPSATPTDSPLRTKTPGPTITPGPIGTLAPTDTPAATATRTRGPVSAPATRTPTAVPGGARAAIGPAPDLSAHGLAVTFQLEGRGRVFSAGQKMWFRMTVRNLTEDVLRYGYLGVAVSNGHFHTSWSGSSLQPQGVLNWRDWVSVDEPGDYTLTLAMCLSPLDDCQGGGRWVNVSAPVPITIGAAR
jgi:hypothetical protein